MSEKRELRPGSRGAIRPRRSSWRLSLVCLVIGSLSVGVMAALHPQLRPQLSEWLQGASIAERPGDEAEWLVRSTLLTLNDANRTGNYTVLWALSAPSFQAANSPERLAVIFAGIRRTGLDAAAVAASPIDWLEPPFVEKAGVLRLGGRIGDAEQEVGFVLAFEAVGGVWRLVEINIRLASPRLASGR